MSTSAPTGKPASAHPSRQQLDELDALLQRMLALPVHRLDDEPEGPPQPQELTALIVPVPLPVPLPEPVEEWGTVPLPPAESPATPALTVTFVPSGPPSEDTALPLVRTFDDSPAADLAPSLAWFWLPFVAVNRLFDGVTLALGPVGGLLRGRGGRAFLGSLGLLLLALAAAFVLAERIGWTW